MSSNGIAALSCWEGSDGQCCWGERVPDWRNCKVSDCVMPLGVTG